MPDPIPACFRGGAAAAPPGSATAGPSVTTSIYETPLGLAALTWSRTVLGLSLRVELRLAVAAAGGGAAASFRFRLRPWLLWKRRGSKGFHSHGVEFSWDLTRARFPAGGGPEPSSGFFVAVVVNGEMFLAAGDMEAEAYKRSKARRGRAGRAVLLSRREHVVFPGSGRIYATRASFGGKEREILIDLGGSAAAGEKEAKLWVAVDGKKVIQVKRLRWKFRGNEKVAVDGGGKVQVSWDVHSWLFNREPIDVAAAAGAAAPPTAAPEFGHASFMFRFEMEEADEGGGGERWRMWSLDNFGGIDHSSGSIGSGGVVALAGKKKKSLLKTSSSSSSSSASSGSSSSVAEWASAEESELRGSGGFSLLVCVWKN
ncbi:unnamed protein product [Spirodela intermedia]|uniref:Uncharacterized protein n=1 Tax=Spirodela intermedia TaxID=51605 RepID=A0A7I8LBP1_SPIIN|nr:unnamed protein product [Spirodela intermedia]